MRAGVGGRREGREEDLLGRASVCIAGRKCEEVKSKGCSSEEPCTGQECWALESLSLAHSLAASSLERKQPWHEYYAAVNSKSVGAGSCQLTSFPSREILSSSPP